MTYTNRSTTGRRLRQRYGAATALGAVVITAAISALAVLPPATAHTAAAHEADHDGKSVAISLDEAQLLDAKALSRLYGVSVKESLAFALDSRSFAAFSTELAEKYPHSYAAAVWGEKPGAPAVLRFVGRVPAEVAEAARKLPFEVVVEGDAKRSALAQQEIAIQANKQLVKAGFDQSAVAPLPDGGFAATAWSKRGVKAPRLPEGIKVDIADEPLMGDLHSRGGGNMLDGGFRECTSGFSVITPGGVTGISTAAHCTGLDQYQEPNTGTTYDMDFEQQHYGVLGDFEWHTTPTHIDPAEYFARTNEIRDVNSVSGVLPVGTPTCMFGQTSDVRWCDTVAFQNVVASFTGPLHCFLTLNATSSAQPGDSGGPVSWGTEADGLIKGFMTVGGVRRDTWVRASLMPAAIGVSVRTK